MYKHPACALLPLVLAVFIGTSMPARANNIRILGDPVLKNRDTATQSVQIHFDVAWDHSWRTQRPNNWDAAWIFIKCWDGGNWNHVYLVDTVGSWRAGSTSYYESVNPDGTEYYVASREGDKTQMPMTMEPGYSQGYRRWEPEDEFDTIEEKLCVGYFLYRAGYGAGDVRVPGVYVTWNYGSQLFQNEDDLTVKVFAVEMVYVPEGGFFIGGRYTRLDKNFYQQGSFTYNATAEKTAVFDYPFKVSSEEAITVQPTPDDTTLWAMPINNQPSITRGVIPEAFPKGFQAFYIMKYELTQQAWCEFLNCLNYEQQSARMDIDLTQERFNVGKRTLGPGYYYNGSKVDTIRATEPMKNLRYYITIKQTEPYYLFGCDRWNMNFGVIDNVAEIGWPHTDGSTLFQEYNADGQDVAMYFVSVYDLFAYAEFSCLRPMTELEYEKACRGNKQVAGKEFAWGSEQLNFFGKAYLYGNSQNTPDEYPANSGNYGFHYTVNEFGNGLETSSPYRTFNCGYTRSCYRYWNTPAPLRVGSFADSVTTRVQAGATYWGVMNMSDNVSEVCISVYNDLGRKFEGVHGCGNLHYATGKIQQEEWNLPANEDAKQYVIDRGMCFMYSYYNAGVNDLSWNYHQLWNQTTTNHTTPNYWPIAAGMISSRHRALNSGPQNLKLRNFMTQTTPTNPVNFSVGVNYPVMRGIRCVRTDKAER